MKKLFFVLALIALCGAAFANNISDPEVTLTGWRYNYRLSNGNGSDDVSDLGDGKGFTVTADVTADYSIGYFTNYLNGGCISGWVFDENEPITLTILESDIVAEDDALVSVKVWSYMYSYYIYTKPYTGAGEYVFTAEDITAVFGNVDSLNGLAPGQIDIYVGTGNVPATTYLPAGGKFTATFAKVDKPETVVPEPASAAYALLGLGSLMGIKRRIKK